MTHSRTPSQVKRVPTSEIKPLLTTAIQDGATRKMLAALAGVPTRRLRSIIAEHQPNVDGRTAQKIIRAAQRYATEPDIRAACQHQRRR